MTTEECENEVQILKNKIIQITKENEKLKINIQNLHDLLGYEICEYFKKCGSLKNTTKHFYFNNVEECYYALVEYFGCYNTLQSANDFIECYKEIFGKEYTTYDS